MIKVLFDLFNSNKFLISYIFIIFLQRYESLTEILLTATESGAASRSIEWLVI